MKKIIFIFILLMTMLTFFNIFNLMAIAAGDEDKKEATPSANAPVRLTNPLTGTQKSEGIPVLLGKIISSVLGIIGSLALVMFIYGGATWMMSTGNQEQVTKGKNILIWATVGIVIIFTAYALVKFVLDTVTGAR